MKVQALRMATIALQVCTMGGGGGQGARHVGPAFTRHRDAP